MNHVLVSIIVTTKNSQFELKRLLMSLRNQSYKRIEIIVVDNHSRDATARVAKALGSRVYTQGPERSSQRNYGAKKARGKYFLFLDTDMEVTPSVLGECVEKIKKNKQVGAVVIPEQSKGEGFWAACKALERRCYLVDPNIEAARFFEQNVFWKFGGYDESMTGPEDWDLPYRIQKTYKIDRIRSFITHYEGSVTLTKLAKKKFYYGTYAVAYIKRHLERTIFQQVFYLFRPSFYRNWRLLLRYPHIAVGMIVMLFVEQCAGAAGFLWEYIKMGRKIIVGGTV